MKLTLAFIFALSFATQAKEISGEEMKNFFDNPINLTASYFQAPNSCNPFMGAKSDFEDGLELLKSENEMVNKRIEDTSFLHVEYDSETNTAILLMFYKIDEGQKSYKMKEIKYRYQTKKGHECG